MFVIVLDINIKMAQELISLWRDQNPPAIACEWYSPKLASEMGRQRASGTLDFMDAGGRGMWSISR